MAETADQVPRWLIAAWPGMGNVALNAAIYLLSKLDMQIIAEMKADELFDVGHVEVKNGIVQPGRTPRNRFFLWSDPEARRDLLIFLGEEQPAFGKSAFCGEILNRVRELRVERVVTFAAMATQMHPQHASRLFGAATDEPGLEELKRLGLTVLEDGQISGLNGVLLGSAAVAGLPGACLLGEMPHIFSQLPFPKASLAILEAFTRWAGVDVDLAELSAQVQVADERLGELLARIEEQFGPQQFAEEEEFTPPAVEEKSLSPADADRIEQLFAEAESNRSKAFELKQELDRLEVFRDYEDRFLDLFKKSRGDEEARGA